MEQMVAQNFWKSKEGYLKVVHRGNLGSRRTLVSAIGKLAGRKTKGEAEKPGKET